MGPPLCVALLSGGGRQLVGELRGYGSQIPQISWVIDLAGTVIAIEFDVRLIGHSAAIEHCRVIRPVTWPSLTVTTLSTRSSVGSTVGAGGC